MRYRDWAAQWWAWIIGLPTDRIPFVQTGAVDCSDAQRGHPGGGNGVWFLAGAGSSDPVTRSCTVPAGVALFTPLITTTYLDVPGTPRSRLIALARQFGGTYSGISATLDGSAIPSRDLFLVKSSKLYVHSDPRGLFGAGNGAQAGLGFWLFLRPLAPGSHVLHFTGTGTTASSSFSQDVTYDLTVE